MLKLPHSDKAHTRALLERFSEALIPLGMPDPPAAVRRNGMRQSWLKSSRAARWIDKLVRRCLCCD